jgi:putative oxidoreductase
MRNVFTPLSSYAFALFRVVAGLLYLQHGTQKLLGWPSAVGFALPPLLKAARTVELICGLLIMIGLLTEYAAFIACGEMASAYFMAHFPHGFWPINNKGELAALLCFAFLYITTHGAGIWSVDGLRRKVHAPVLRTEGR